MKEPLEHRLVAHRGFPARFPENSVAGVAAALACGARFVEVDIQLTRNGVPVLLHDADLRRLCDSPRAIFDTDHEDLAALCRRHATKPDAGTPSHPVPLLADLAPVFQEASAALLFVELKPQSLAHHGRRAVLDAVLREVAAFRERVVFISFDGAVLEQAHVYGPVGLVHDRWDHHHSAEVAALEPEYYFCNAELLPEDGPLALPDRRLVVYETVDAGRATTLMDRGVDLVETFDVCGMADRLRAMAPG
ncbi:MAG: glycerophosphodiester phosphodiesterase family protein [Gammaproteobacteria bacterium]|nr:glycerophosphodiester phosphodiesterase family protein [Gammaproteobacteria bacterium]